MASPAPSPSRPTDPSPGGDSQSAPTTSPARPQCELLVVTTSDELLLELGDALGGQASIRPVESVASALEHLGTSRHAQLIAFDARGVSDPRADLERIRAKAPHAALLAFAELSAEQATAAALKGTEVFAILPLPVDRAKTSAIFEGALASAVEKRAAARPPQKSFASQTRSPAPLTVSNAPAPRSVDTRRKLPVVPIVAGAAGALLLIATATWFFMRDTNGTMPPSPAAPTRSPIAAETPQSSTLPAPIVATPVTLVQGSSDELLERARLAMRERRYTEPAGDNALVYLRSALAADPTNAEANDGLARIGGVLIARVEEAANAGNFEEAVAALAALKSALPDDSRVRPLEAKLAQARADLVRRQEEARLKRVADLTAERLRDGRLLEPANDSAKLYLQQLREAAPLAANTQRLQKELSAAYMRKARETALAGRSTESERWLTEARGIGVTPADITTLQREVAASRQRAAAAEAAEADRLAQLARERLKEGRLVEPSGDNAAHYLGQLQAADSSHAALAPAGRDLAARLLERAGGAVREGRAREAETDLAAARRWGADAKEILAIQQVGSAKAQSSAPRGAALARNLKRTRYVAPEYPEKALEKGTSGSVTVEFIVDAKGEPSDLRVSAANPPGVFDRAASAAVRRWRYEPMIVDGVPVEVPTRAVIRFEAPKE